MDFRGSKNNNLTIAVVGLGYVGLPLAVAFGRQKITTIGFDINREKVAELKRGYDRNEELEGKNLLWPDLEYTNNPNRIKKANFVIVAVPTPVTKAKIPDLTPIIAASTMVGQNLVQGATVVYESTVYPGVTEEICRPILEKESGLQAGRDFFIGYSPERINPGDHEHRLETIQKVVSGMDQETLERIAKVYSIIVEVGVHKVSSIKVAEAAKVIENIQRDLNIALVNELSIIFHKLGIPTKDVLAAAATKWNWQHYFPGLVGGHCISIDPYYLTYKAEELGYHPQIILAGRRVNDGMAEFVGNLVIKGLIQTGKVIERSNVLILGITFKENIKDTRNSKVVDLIEFLKAHRIKLTGYDPVVGPAIVANEFGVPAIDSLNAVDQPFDAIVYTVNHQQFESLTLKKLKQLTDGKPVLIDVKMRFDKKEAEKVGFWYESL